MTRKPALGKGLNALINARTQVFSPLEEVQFDANLAVSKFANQADTEQLHHLPLEVLQRGKFQPRREFDSQRLQELADSIKSRGVMQPIVVRAIASQGLIRYEIIAGERRWRAAQIAGLSTIPAVIRVLDDQAALALALIENIQREDLNAIDEALAYQRFMQEFDLTQQQVADIVNKSRAQVANLMRLLALDEQVQHYLAQAQIDMGHARALLMLPSVQQRQVAQKIISEQLNVRQTEALVKKLQAAEVDKTASISHHNDVLSLEKQLAELLKAAVEIRHLASGKGKVLIYYDNLNQLDGILTHIK